MLLPPHTDKIGMSSMLYTYQPFFLAKAFHKIQIFFDFNTNNIASNVSLFKPGNGRFSCRMQFSYGRIRKQYHKQLALILKNVGKFILELVLLKDTK